MSYFKSQVGFALVASVLVGCGGGGGGTVSGTASPAPTSLASLTASNQTIASQDVSSTALGLFNSSQYALGAASTNESALYTFAFGHLDLLSTYVADIHKNATVTGAIQSQSYSCPYGGNFVVSGIDADNSGTATAGDSISLSFNSCNGGSGTVSGSLSFHIDALTGNYGAVPSNVAVTMTFGNLSANSSSYSAAINGGITVSGARTGTNAFTQSISTSSLSTSATYGSVTRARALTGFNASETRTADATYTYLSRYSLTGTLTSSGFSGTQAVSFSTPTTIVRRGTDVYPYTGVLQISGASNSALRLTVTSNSQVQEDLDANGDGIYESTSTVNWNTLL